MEFKIVKHMLLSVCFLAACGQGGGHGKKERWTQTKEPAPTTVYGERVHSLGEFPGLTTSKKDINGHPLRIRCSTCHRLIPAEEDSAKARAPKEFHKGIKLAHGENTCRTCHDPPGFETYRLGDGTQLPYAQLMKLCGQCHSGQFADYKEGLHGGMAGHWDLNKGPRDRNHCVDCHDPHRPAIPQVRPAPRPRYRFLDKAHKQENGRGTQKR